MRQLESESPSLFAMLRVRNEAPWIAYCLSSLIAVGVEAERIYVLDDKSTDGTGAICQHLHANVIRTPFWQDGYDEARDKNYLLGVLLDKGCVGEQDWIFCIDGDEVICNDGRDAIQRAIHFPDAEAYALKIDYLWDRPHQVRVDGWLGKYWRGSLFQAGRAQEGFRNTAYPGNLHCSNIPGGFDAVEQLKVRIAHYGYMHRADRLRKYEENSRRDPANSLRYLSLAMGDTAAAPADQIFEIEHGLTAGPLVLEPWIPVWS